MKKNLLYIIIGLSCWSCNNDNENMAPPFTPQKETRAITYDYPDKDQMLRINLIVENMRMAWDLTKEMAKNEQRREIGFYIYSTKISDNEFNYLIGNFQLGPIVTTENEVPFLHYRNPANNNYCGFFHTHTPLTYVSFDYSRPVGPSRADESMAWNPSFYCPGFVYDYVTPISTGHDINIHSMIYHFGPIVRV